MDIPIVSRTVGLCIYLFCVCTSSVVVGCCLVLVIGVGCWYLYYGANATENTTLLRTLAVVVTTKRIMSWLQGIQNLTCRHLIRAAHEWYDWVGDRR